MTHNVLSDSYLQSLEDYEEEISKRRFIAGIDFAEDNDKEYSVKSVFDCNGELAKVILTDSDGKSIIYER